MKHLRSKHPSLFLLLVCYLAFFVAAFLFHCGQFAQSRALRFVGKLPYRVIDGEDFAEYFEGEEVELLPNGSYRALGADPRFYLKDTKRRVESFSAMIEYEEEPQLLTVFWAKPGQDYSIRRMAYPFGEIPSFRLRAGGGQSFRFDPDIVAGNQFTILSVSLNQKLPFYAYLRPSAAELAFLAIAPALLAAALGLVLEYRASLRSLQGGAAHD